MICTSIQNKTIEEIFRILDSPDIEMAEIRLDRCELTQSEIEELFSCSDVPLVATCRVAEMAGSMGESDAARLAESRLSMAIKSGAAYVDLEMEAPAMLSKRIRRAAQEEGTMLIRSYHDFEGTDSFEALVALVDKCRSLGAEIVKLVTTARSKSDVEKVMSLYDKFPPEGLVAFCMGAEGKESRIECLKKGAPYTYAALTEDDSAAPGQWPAALMRETIYGQARRMAGGGPVRMPASKSCAQRAIIAATLAEGTSRLSGYSPCGDNVSAIRAARELGAEVTENGAVLTIKGTGGKPGSFCKDVLHTGESGFLTRLTIPILAQIGKGEVKVTGEKTLPGRPLKGAAAMMRAFGVELVNENPAHQEVHVPLTIKGNLVAGNAEVSGKDGSQLISGLLSALPLADRDSTLRLTEPKSIPYIFMTLDVLKQFGIRIENEMEGGEEFFETQDWNLCESMTFHIKGGQRYKAADMEIEADWSAAANFLVAGALFGKVALSGLDTRSLQADLSIMDILTEAGASLSQEEESKTIHVQKAPLRAFEVDASNCPDLFPIIAVLAAFCQGESKIRGVDRLASKESDRGKAIHDMLRQMGVNAIIRNDTLIVRGHSLAQRLLSGRLLKGGKYTSWHDHRMVMALMVASLGADSPIEIDDTECVGKSFPTFMETFGRIAEQ